MRSLLLCLVLVLTGANTVLGSAVVVSDGYGARGDTAIVITISLDNSQAYAGIEIEFQYDPDLLVLNRIEPMARLAGLSDAGYYEYSVGKAALIAFDISGATLAPDTGAIFNVIFDIPPDGANGQSGLSITEATAVFDDLQYDGSITITDGFFYVWDGFFCGDVDGNLFPAPDIVDLVYLVTYMFQFGPAPPVMEATDVDCSGGEGPDIADLVYLVNYMFQFGPEPDCPPCDGIMAKLAPNTSGGQCDFETRLISDRRFCLRVHTTFPVDLAGFQQTFEYDAAAITVDSIVRGPQHKKVDLYYHATDGTISLGMIDITGKHYLKRGESDIVAIYYSLKESASATEEHLLHLFTKAADRYAQLVPVDISAGKGSALLPKTYALYPNYPNPFNAETTIKFDLPRPSEVKLTIVNILGQRVQTLIEGHQLAGYHQIRWDGTNSSGGTVATGVYFYRLEADGFESSRKMLLLK